MNQIVAITMPKWGLEMTEGTLAAWHLPEGAAAAKGAELADIETAKIVNTLEANESGTLRRLVAKVGETLPVGALLAVVAAPEVPETDIAAFINSFHPIGEAAPPPPAPAPVANAAPAPTGEVNATPVARRMAAELGIDLADITGTGRNGRISQEDVEAFAAARAAAPAPAPKTDFTPFSATRKAIAAALVRTVQTVPSYLITMDLAMDKLLALRAELNTRPGQKLSVNDFLIRAAALALAEVPEVNVHVSDDGTRPFAQANLSIAVASDAGVFMPVIRDAGAKTLWEIAAASASLAAKARERKLTPEDLAEGSFSISNLGMFGVRAFEALINAPQAAILAVGATRREALETPSGVAFGSVMSVTLACDHRAIDGALGAKFLNAFKSRIEQPLGLVLPA